MTSELWSGSSVVNLRAAVSEEGVAHRKLCLLQKVQPVVALLENAFVSLC